MRLFSLILCICISNFFNSDVYADCKKQVKIAVIDTGFFYKNKGLNAHLCPTGHKDFSIDQQFKNGVPIDKHGHGTNIVGIIDYYGLKANANFCIIVIKYYSSYQSNRENALGSARALAYVNEIKPDIVNYSGGGAEKIIEEEKSTVKFLDNGGKFFAAAGNDGNKLGIYKFYPAMYDSRIIIVGNLHTAMVKSISSNYGSTVTRWEYGENISAYGLTMTGTSQATAVATGKSLEQCSARK